MTAAGCDELSNGRFTLGLGPSGPQVVEGFHGLPFDHPLRRMVEYTELCRRVWRREPLALAGASVQGPAGRPDSPRAGQSLRLFEKPVRSTIPIWWASIKSRSVARAAEVADGWLPALFLPEQAQRVWGADMRAGAARRSRALSSLQVCAGGDLAIGEEYVGDHQTAALQPARDHIALYVGGMGAVGKNFYNEICRLYGYEREADSIQELFLSGRRDEASALVPHEWVVHSNLVGPPSFIKERIAAYREAGVTMLNVNPIGPEPVQQLELVAGLI
jgi:F420-dependent oxidoreductase-like protein